MKRETYRQMSETAKGRHEVHEMMLAEIKTKIDNLVAGAPAANREKAAATMDKAFAKLETMGNGELFNFFADDELSMRAFVGYLQDALLGKIW